MHSEMYDEIGIIYIVVIILMVIDKNIVIIDKPNGKYAMN